MTVPVSFELIKARVPLTAILQHYGLTGGLRKRGHLLIGVCPIHSGSNNRQFVVDTDRNSWRCFSDDCGLYGDVVDFVAAYDHVPLPEAAARIAAWFALAASPQPPTRTAMTEVASKFPTHRAYVTENVTEGKKIKTYWTKVGAAWLHKDLKGLTVSIAPGISVNGRMVLREWSEDETGAREPGQDETDEAA